MAIVIKGFGILNEFESTIPDGLAPVGELSTRATTFSTDKTTHTDPDLDGGRFINFKTVNDTDLPIELPAAAEAYILNVIENISKFDMGYSADVQFNTIYPGLNGVVVGDSVLYMNRLIPTFVSFMVDIDSVSYSIKIWFSNEAFESEYDEFGNTRSANIPTIFIPELTCGSASCCGCSEWRSSRSFNKII